MIFLSGASQFKFTYYIKKLVDDLLLYTHIHKTYDIFVFENTHEVNYLCVDNIYQWIQQYIHPKYNNITICGLSNGGCIGSHVMKTIVNKTKLLMMVGLGGKHQLGEGNCGLL